MMLGVKQRQLVEPSLDAGVGMACYAFCHTIINLWKGMVKVLRKKILVLAAVLTFSLGLMTGCGAKDSNNSATSPSESADTVEETPDVTDLPEATASDDNVLDDTVDGAGNMLDDAGDVVKDAGDTVNDAVDDTVNGARDAVDDATDNTTNNTTGDNNTGATDAPKATNR